MNPRPSVPPSTRAEDRPNVPGAAGILSAASGLGLCVAVISTLMTFVRIDEPPEGWSSLTALSAAIMATSVLAGGLLLLLWFGVLLPLKRRSFAAAAGLTGGIGMAFFLFDPFGAFDDPEGAARRQAVLSCLALGFGFGVALARRVKKMGWSGAPVMLAGLPISCLGGLIWHWGNVYDRSLWLVLFGLALLALALRWVDRRRDVRRAAGALAAIHGVIIVLGLWDVATRSPTLTSEQPPAATGELSPRHIVFITVDTLRRDALSVYNPTTRPTPRIDALAQDSLAFDHAYSSAPWTLPALTSIMTGLPVAVHGQDSIEVGDLGSLPTLASSLREAGYYTAAIGFNPFLDPGWGLNRGFTEYTAYPQPHLGIGVGPYALRELFRDKYQKVMGTEARADRAIDWLSRNDERPFFLWLHIFDPHSPYSPPSQYLPDSEGRTSFYPMLEPIDSRVIRKEERARIRDLYLAEVQYVDDNVGRVLQRLKDLGLYDDSLVVFTSDHGEEFWDHGDFEHGHTVYEELIEVPLLIKLPGNSPTGVVPGRFSTVELAPATLALTGSEPATCLPEPALLNVLAKNEGVEDEPILAQGTVYDDFQTALIMDDYKWIHYEILGQEELFDLAVDPQEHRELQYELPEVAARARQLYQKRQKAAELLRSCLGLAGENSKDLEPDQIQRLKSLGYL